jgi:hypothetical protein
VVKKNVENNVGIIDFEKDIEPIEESVFLHVNPEELVAKLPMTMTHPDWEDHVMSQFASKELFDGRPKVSGLRRVVRLLLGRIVESYPEVLQVPTFENGQRSTCKYTVKIYQTKSLDDGDEPDYITYSDVADAWRENIEHAMFAKFPPAMAATRAEGRALRKLLNLSIAAAEEIDGREPEENVLEGYASESQITRLDIKCEQLDIDVMKFINQFKKNEKDKYKNIKDVQYRNAAKMFPMLNEYEREIKEVPDSIKGYLNNWRND